MVGLFGSYEAATSRSMSVGSERGSHEKNREFKLSENWQAYIHPDGELYYVNPTLKVTTSNNIISREVADMVESCAEEFHEKYDQYIARLNDFTICIRVDEDDGGYYDPPIIDHDNHKHLFPGDSQTLIPEEGHGLYYWLWLSRFPMSHPLPSTAEAEVVGCLVHWATEMTLGNLSSSSSFSLSTCFDHLDLIASFQSDGITSSQDLIAQKIWMISSVMADISIHRDHYKYGHQEATTNYVTVTPEPPSWTTQVLNACVHLLCLGVHERYRERFSRTYTNMGLNDRNFRESLEEMLREWSDSTLLSIVFLSANIGLLSLNGELLDSQRTVVLVSVCLSVASSLAGMYLVWQHRPRSNANIDDAAFYLRHASGKLFRGYEQGAPAIRITGVLLCTPLVFLLWSIITFSAAILWLQVSQG